MKKYNIVIVGGGSTFTPGFLKSFCRMKEEFPINKLVLFDINAERQKTIGEFGKILFEELYPEADFTYTTDIEKTYTESDFVFMQMRVGGYKMRESDEKTPLSMGMIGQETVGAGGMAYGLRSTKEMIKAVYDIRRYAPDAWILNYSNPAAIVAEALRREFPNDKKILNICDQPENVVRSCSRLLSCDYKNLDPVYFGLNHYGWFTHIYDKTNGDDLLSEIKELIKEKGFLPQDAEQRDPSWLDTYGMVQPMMEDFPDYLPNTYNQYYLYPEYKVEHLNPNYTRANEVIDGREKRVFEECKTVIKAGTIKGYVNIHEDAHAEFMIEVAMSIAYNENNRYIVIVENNGAINNLPDDAMVEVAAVLGSNGPRPMRVGNIPLFQKGLLENQLACEKLLIDAYFEESYEKALQAFTLNRLINDAKKARKILDALIEENKGYWPEFKKAE
ncbi:6-phospho-alpha-glucosidase [Sporolactobacillus terrae]|uniref:6-phospho-alpha-glucosidase n=1 Tax=Sporolactobacillus terrae TaxID=269673 RepID=UPI00048DEF16|nr:6-phospho-alpha-glucosidase [Sporolactobacillus terrae]